MFTHERNVSVLMMTIDVGEIAKELNAKLRIQRVLPELIMEGSIHLNLPGNFEFSQWSEFFQKKYRVIRFYTRDGSFLQIILDSNTILSSIFFVVLKSGTNDATPINQLFCATEISVCGSTFYPYNLFGCGRDNSDKNRRSEMFGENVKDVFNLTLPCEHITRFERSYRIETSDRRSQFTFVLFSYLEKNAEIGQLNIFVGHNFAPEHIIAILPDAKFQ